MNRLAIRHEAERIIEAARNGKATEEVMTEFCDLIDAAGKSDESRLVHCPFCGSKALYITRVETYIDADTAIFCNACKATVTWETIEGTGDEQTEAAIRNWNRRATEESA